MLQASRLPRFKHSIHFTRAVEKFKVIHFWPRRVRYLSHELVIRVIVGLGPTAIDRGYKLNQLRSCLSLLIARGLTREAIVFLISEYTDFEFDHLCHSRHC